MPLLLVVSPNLALDRILALDSFEAGQVHRCGAVLTQAGGKGANLARVHRQLGGSVRLIGLAGRSDRAHLELELCSAGIDADVIDGYDGNSRICTVITGDRARVNPTVINEESGMVYSSAIDAFFAAFDRWAPAADAVVFTGSLSRGLPETFYRDLIARTPGEKKLLALDAAGKPLREAGQSKRSLFLKPNVSELCEVAGITDASTLKDFAQIGQIARRHFSGVMTMAVTAGDRGAVLISANSMWHAEPPEIRTVNPIGCGDAFLAGYAKGILDGSDPVTALRLAVAAATSDAGTIRPGAIEPDEIEDLFGRVLVKQLSTNFR